MKESASESRYWVPILGHAIRTIEIFEDADTQLNLQEITARTGISKSSVFRILYTLEHLGYVGKNSETRKYHLGLRILEIAHRARATRNVVQLARPYMRELQNQFLETVNLAVFQNNDIHYVDILESSQAFRMTGEVGSRAPFHATAVGKSIAAFLPEGALKALLAGKRLPRFTRNTVTTQAAFLKMLAKVRQQGYGVDNEETERGAFCVGVPIFNGGDQATHSISVSGPVHRVRTQAKAIIRELLRVSAGISHDLK